MLAYVFWHWPSDPAGYEQRLVAFQRALAAHPPPGFHSSTCFRSDEPWIGGAPGYVDWYLVADWAALGALNEAAVLGARREPHDAAASRAAGGTAGVYRLAHGGHDLRAVRHAIWLSKPRGTPYEPFEATLRMPGAALWQRQMTLGPALEYVLLAPAPPPVDAEVRAGLEPLG